MNDLRSTTAPKNVSPELRTSADWHYSTLGWAVDDLLDHLAEIRADVTATGDYTKYAENCELWTAASRWNWMRGDDRSAALDFESALIAYGGVCALAGGEAAKKARSANASNAGKIRAQNNPATRVKPDVHTLWQQWRCGKYPGLGSTNEKFAMQVTRKWPELASLKTILNWMTVWAREERLKVRVPSS